MTAFSLVRIVKSLFFTELTPLLRLGKTRPLQVDDLPSLPERLYPQQMPATFLSLPTEGAWRFLLAIWRAQGPGARAAAGIVLMLVASGTATPLAMHALMVELTAITGHPEATLAA